MRACITLNSLHSIMISINIHGLPSSTGVQVTDSTGRLRNAVAVG